MRQVPSAKKDGAVSHTLNAGLHPLARSFVLRTHKSHYKVVSLILNHRNPVCVRVCVCMCVCVCVVNYFVGLAMKDPRAVLTQKHDVIVHI